MLHVEVTAKGKMFYEVLSELPTNEDDSFGNDTTDWFYTILCRTGEGDPIMVGDRDLGTSSLMVAFAVVFEDREFDSYSGEHSAMAFEAARYALKMFELELLRVIE